MPTPDFTNTAADQHPLAQMRPLHLPDAIDSWPLAPGWYVLTILLVTTLGLSLYFFIKHRRNTLFKRQALETLAQIRQAYEQEPKAISQHAQAISALYKRIALSHLPRNRISQLSGSEWLDFLDKMTNSHFFTEQEGQLLGDSLFKNPQAMADKKRDLEILLQESESIIKKLKSKHIRSLQT